MNKNLKIALIIAAIIAVIYFWKKKNSDDSEKSEFLGGLFTKKGSQRWAEKLAAQFCNLLKELKGLELIMNSPQANGIAAKRMAIIEEKLQSILETLAMYGYSINIPTCKLVFKGGLRGKTYRPGDQLGKDCLCKDKTTWAPECCKAAK